MVKLVIFDSTFICGSLQKSINPVSVKKQPHRTRLVLGEGLGFTLLALSLRAGSLTGSR